MTSEKNEKLESLRNRVKELKKERDDLNAKLRSKRDSIMSYYGEIDKLLKEAKKFKETRDEANKKVSEAKKKRDESNSKIAELNKKLSEFKSHGSETMPRRDYEKLKGEYEKLNWKMQTSPCSKQRETEMVKRLEQMESSIREYELLKPAEKEAVDAEKELRKVRKGADAHHAHLLKESEDGEKAHGEMHEIYKKVDEKREKAKKIEEEFLEIKTAVDEAHNKFVETLNELRAEEEALGIVRAKDRKVEAEKLKKDQEKKAGDLLEELRKGKVLKTEDLLMLQGGDN